MKSLKTIFASLILITFATVNVNAQNEATETGEANATIIAPLTLTENRTLEFGELVKSSTGGTVAVPAEENPAERTFGGGITSIPADVWRSAEFTVGGDDNYSFSIDLDESITLDGPESATMSVATSMSAAETGNTTSGGTFKFWVGGTLTIAADQVTGSYNGSYEVTVQYE
jgi:hypothetical protein